MPATIAQIPAVYGARLPGVTGQQLLGRAPPAAGDRGRGPAPPGRPERGASTRRPPLGLLDLTISWAALAGASPGWAALAGTSPGSAALGRLGPITTEQATPLVAVAASDPGTQWRVILVDATGRALAVERVHRGRLCQHADRPTGVVGRVTVTIPITALAPPSGGGIRAAVLRAARRAAVRASEIQAADAAAGGCAHTLASVSYRPPARIKELVEARDQTCRQPNCRQPAWRSDLDHTRPWDQGGLTCSCNLGGRCRTHHQIKQQPGWHVTQPRPGWFQITTPAGRTYDIHPDVYPS